MGKTLVQNNGALPKAIGGRWVLPGESVLVDDDTASQASVDIRFRRAVGGGVQAVAGDTGQVFGMLSLDKALAAESLVSDAGNVAAADLATTTGTPGQIVRIADGDDRGALLVWAVPEGATTYVWCWWLCPSESYF